MRHALRRARRFAHATQRPVAATLPPIDNLSTEPLSPFPGGKPLTEHEHTIAEDLHDWILGGQDGIVNMLGMILGLAAVTQSKLILIAGGVAGLFAEAIGMAAVAYTSTKASIMYYERERQEQHRLIDENPELQQQVLITAYLRKGLSHSDAHRIVTELTHDRAVWLEMLMEEHLHLYRPEAAKPVRSAIIVGLAATAGSLVPLIPFIFMTGFSAIITALAVGAVTLFMGGAFSATLTVGDWRTRGIEMASIGVLAALVGFIIGSLFTRGAAGFLV